MDKEDLKRTLHYFKKFFEREYGRVYDAEPVKARYYWHKGYFDFPIIVFIKTKEVYQLNSDHEVTGIELKTFVDMCVRFKSFMGYDINKYDEESDKIIK